MFKVATNPTFTHPVDVFVPADSGHVKQTCRATFRVKSADDDDAGPDLNTTAGSTAFLKEVVIELHDLVGEDDKALPYSDQLRDQLLKVPYFRAACARTYFAAISKAALGN